MKKIEGMKWGKKYQVKQIPVKKNTPSFSGAKKIAEALYLYATLLLLGGGLLLMYTDVFFPEESFVSCKIFLVLAALFFTAGNLFLRGKKGWNLSCLAVAAGWGIIRHRTLFYGMTTIVNEILHFINDYYTVHLPQFQVEEEACGGFLEAHAFLLFLLLWQMSFALIQKRSRIFSLLPGMVLFFGELLVGYAPEWAGLLCELLGACGVQLWCLSAKAEKKNQLTIGRIKCAGLLCAALLCVCGCAGLLWTGTAENLVGKQSRMLAYQHYIEQAIVTGNPILHFRGESGKVNNHTPHYLGKEVLSVTTSNRTKENLYLRGYVGDTYDDGNWRNRSEKLFSGQEWGSEEAGYEILDLLYAGQKENVEESNQGTYTITYVAPQNQYAYLPYFTDASGLREELTVSADGMLFREKQEQLTVDGLLSQSFFTVLENESMGVLASETPVEEAYEDYLSLYLEVPNGLEQIDELGMELSDQLTDMGLLEPSMARTTAAVCLVRNAVNERVTYNKNLNLVPAGEDVVEYFLFTSGEGYCTHYASAGVLLFRELGIPARYVTGYVVEEDAVSYSGEGTNWTAAVLDNDAHAWVEIYLEGVGWLPIEMVEGLDDKFDSMRLLAGADGAYGVYFENLGSWYVYALNNTVTTAGLEDYLEAVSGENPYLDENASAVEAADAAEAGTENADGTKQNPVNKNLDGKKQDSTETLLAEATESAGQTVERSGSGGERGPGEKDSAKEQENRTLHITIIIVIICVGLLLCVCGVRIFFSRKKKKLFASFSQKNHRRAVKSIASEMYRLLRKQGAFFGKRVEDVDFRSALYEKEGIFSKEEAEKLWKIVEQAAYGNGEITRGDVSFCRKMYRKLLK